MTVSSFDKCTQLLLLLEPTQFICRIRNVSQMGFHGETKQKKPKKNYTWKPFTRTTIYDWLSDNFIQNHFGMQRLLNSKYQRTSILLSNILFAFQRINHKNRNKFSLFFKHAITHGSTLLTSKHGYLVYIVRIFFFPFFSTIFQLRRSRCGYF